MHRAATRRVGVHLRLLSVGRAVEYYYVERTGIDDNC